MISSLKRSDLTFIIAGGDVLKNDLFGQLGLSLEGARERDLMISARLKNEPAVWLPGGGYHEDSWRLLAGTILAVFFQSRLAIPSSKSFIILNDTLDTIKSRFE